MYHPFGRPCMTGGKPRSHLSHLSHLFVEEIGSYQGFSVGRDIRIPWEHFIKIHMFPENCYSY